MNKNLIWAFGLVLWLGIQACSKGPTQAVIHTEYGDITVELYDDTPMHKANFIKLVEEDFYKNLLFHRVMSGFMMQGGDPTSRDSPVGELLGRGGPGYTIPSEINQNHVHTRGALAAARKPDSVNPDKKSNGSQFYIVLGQKVSPALLDQKERISGFEYSPEQRAEYAESGGTPALDMDYTVFGRVVDGWEVMDQIAALPVDANNRPNKNVSMSIEIK